MSSCIAVLDLGVGNLYNMYSALVQVAPTHHVIVTNNAQIIQQSNRIVIPGQGNVGGCMRILESNQCLKQAVIQAVQTKPILAVCMGLQMLTTKSTETTQECIGILNCNTNRFSCAAVAPHVAWNSVFWNVSHNLWQGVPTGTLFYFAHSFCVDASHAYFSATSWYYGTQFTSAIVMDNVCTTQFHPERSGYGGLLMLANFIKWQP